MRSRIFEGKVFHSRKTPVKNRFTFRTYFLYLDLDELDRVFKKSFLYSVRRPAFARFRYTDHLIHADFESSNSFKAEVVQVLRDNGITREVSSIRLLTQLRYFGFAMNPVSFYFCFGPDGRSIEAIIAEVNNTPWGEQHLYVIDANLATKRVFSESGTSLTAKGIEKEFHVSPFMEIDMKYDMRFSIEGNQKGTFSEEPYGENSTLAVSMSNIQHGKNIFHVAMKLKSKPITSRSLVNVLFSYPMISWKIFAGIYWQAAKLYWKRCPFVAHPGTIRTATKLWANDADSRESTCDSQLSLDHSNSSSVLAGK